MPRLAVDVMLKSEILDPQGAAVARVLPQLGLTGVSDLRIGKHVEFVWEGAAEDAEDAARKMADAVLSNPVIEHYHVRVLEA